MCVCVCWEIDNVSQRLFQSRLQSLLKERGEGRETLTMIERERERERDETRKCVFMFKQSNSQLIDDLFSVSDCLHFFVPVVK